MRIVPKGTRLLAITEAADRSEADSSGFPTCPACLRGLRAAAASSQKSGKFLLAGHSL